ncbi:MAG TPA: carboxymuconolactone decarboxylase family protein [Steroidobacteraceae bacterium]|jgi:AhpD family alkylhydroperoxidase|nr:carboxymuconolactone decarboxylase family protein [Steroidobacteraceae bacterium]
MARLVPVALDALAPPLAAMVERGRRNRMLSSTIPVQIWAHRPNVAAAWLSALEEMHLRSCLPERLRELVRLRIAAITTCQACLVARKSDSVTEEDLACLSSDHPRFSDAERAALRYAELFAGDYFAIDETLFEALAEHFSTEQIVELNLYSALMLAGGRMTYVQRGYDEALAAPTTSDR